MPNPSLQTEESACVEGEDPDLTQAGGVAFERFVVNIENAFNNAMITYHSQSGIYHMTSPYYKIDITKDCL